MENSTQLFLRYFYLKFNNYIVVVEVIFVVICLYCWSSVTGTHRNLLCRRVSPKPAYHTDFLGLVTADNWGSFWVAQCWTAVCCMLFSSLRYRTPLCEIVWWCHCWAKLAKCVFVGIFVGIWAILILKKQYFDIIWIYFLFLRLEFWFWLLLFLELELDFSEFWFEIKIWI